jgi:signal transduction histidine kinase
VVHPETGSLAALGAGFVALTHECRAALQHGVAAVEMLERRLVQQPEQLGLTPELLGLTAEIRSVLDQLGRLHESARSFTAPVELVLAPCDLHGPLLDAWADLAQVRGDRDATLALSSTLVDPTCEADAFALRVVLRNLYDNALAVCTDPVRIDVRIAARGPDALELTVRDNGPGIAPDLLPRVFEPFVSRRAGGTGLGLAIARKLIAAHGGTITVGPGPGAAFVITLPRA